MPTRKADLNPNYQQRAKEYAVGDMVVPYGHNAELAGRVVALYPAIGMADVEFPSGSKRYPVEDLQILDPHFRSVIPPQTDSIPGGIETAEVSGGPEGSREKFLVNEDAIRAKEQPDAIRVAQAFVKKALYWHSNDRRFRATQPEVSNGQYLCPTCRGKGQECYLKPAIYKRREGKSERLLGCPTCLFLIKREDIINDPVLNKVASLRFENTWDDNNYIVWEGAVAPISIEAVQVSPGNWEIKLFINSKLVARYDGGGSYLDASFKIQDLKEYLNKQKGLALRRLS